MDSIDLASVRLSGHLRRPAPLVVDRWGVAKQQGDRVASVLEKPWESAVMTAPPAPCVLRCLHLGQAGLAKRAGRIEAGPAACSVLS